MQPSHPSYTLTVLYLLLQNLIPVVLFLLLKFIFPYKKMFGDLLAFQLA